MAAPKSVAEMKARLMQMTEDERAEWETPPPDMQSARRLDPWDEMDAQTIEHLIGRDIDPMAMWASRLHTADGTGHISLGIDELVERVVENMPDDLEEAEPLREFVRNVANLDRDDPGEA